MESEGRQIKERGKSEVLAASAAADTHHPKEETPITTEPSMIHAYKDKTVGEVKENVGHVIGNQQIEAEGKTSKQQGKAELEQAKNQQQSNLVEGEHLTQPNETVTS